MPRMGMLAYQRNESNFIKQRIIRFAESYKTAPYEALETVSYRLYHNIRWNDKSLLKREIEEGFYRRIIEYVLNDNMTVLKRAEIELIISYFGSSYDDLSINIYSPPTPKELDKYREAVQAHKTELQRLTDATAELRKLEKGCFSGKILDRIGDYIRYCTEIRKSSTMFLYINIYHIGYADGKRAERARRKVRKEKNTPST